MATVSLSNNKQFSCAEDSSILDAARSQGIVLEHSCRTGRCGACKALVLSGDTQPIREEEILTAAEVDAGWILTCARAAKSDVSLAIEDLGRLADLKIQTLPTRIGRLERIAADVMKIGLRLPPSAQFDYIAGQYIDVIGKNGVRRSYSIANAHRTSDNIELHVRQVAGGEMSDYWFNHAKANDLLRFEGPLGTFCYRDKPSTHVIFLATGTGMAPVKAILEDINLTDNEGLGKKIHVYWGGRTPSDIYWAPEFSNLDLRFIPTLSKATSGWTGRQGHVQEAVLADAVDLQDAVVYACGSDKMIHSAKLLLSAHGLPDLNFYSDAFVSSK